MKITKNLRNLFDQYSQEENRLTHSLLHTLSIEKKLLIDFMKFTIGKYPFNSKDTIFIGSQGRYGDEKRNIVSKKDKRESVPDAIIHDKDGTTCILIECKVTAGVKSDQLKRHLTLAKRYGIKKVILLLLSCDRKPPVKIHETIRKYGCDVYWRAWWEIYQWLGGYFDHFIVKELREYMELLEAEIISRKESWEGMMTKFNGMPFGEGEPYSYSRAKWCLNALVEELRNHEKLDSIYEIDKTKGRGQITGRTSSTVWDYLPFAGGKDSNFTNHPHLTFVIKPDWTQVQITLPNGAKSRYWNALREGGKDAFKEMLQSIHKRLGSSRPRQPSAVKLWVEVLQRHYRFQKDVGVKDGELYFDVDCLLEDGKFENRVKTSSAWLDALDTILANRRKANTQIAIVARYDHVSGSVVGKPDFLDETVRALEALKPFYDKITRQNANQ